MMVAAVVLATLLTQAAPQSQSTTLAFTDVTSESGLVCTLTSGAMPSTQILEVKGGGLAVIDYDLDGDLDLFVPNGATLADVEHGPGARLYRNDGALRFTDVTKATGITHTRWSFGAAVGDIDADGKDDLYIACFGPDVLLRNRGDGSFEDITARAGLGDPRWGTSAAFADLDGDGDLDLYVCNYLEFDPAHPQPPSSFKGEAVLAGPRGYRAAADSLYENRGDGTFLDRSVSSGVADPSKARYGLNVAILDFTGDGVQDIFVGNDSQANNLFVRESAWIYRDDGLRSGVAVNGEGSEQATMGIAVADLDGNARPDLLTTNFSSDTNTLHLNLDGRNFDDRTNQFGLGAPSRSLVGWGAGFFDFDHDADEDLLVVNGHVYPSATKTSMDSEYAQRPLLMERRGGRFHAVREAGAWKCEPHVDRTAVFADFDQDGDVDFVIAGLNEPLRVIRNDHISGTAPTEDRPHDWLTVIPRDLRKGVGNRHAVGAEITVTSTAPSANTQGTAVQRRWIVGGGPFESNHAPEAHFGLGSLETSALLEVAVRFPDGVVIKRSAVAPGTRLVFERRD